MEIALNEVPLFIRKGKSIPVGAAAETIEEISGVTLEYVGYPGAFYELYDDDGITPVK